MTKNFILLLILLLSTTQGFSQKYIVVFKDKNNSPYSISKPNVFLANRGITRRIKQGIKITLRDLPPNPSYIQQLINNGGKLLYRSRWINGAVIEADSLSLSKILKLSFVAGVEGGIPLKATRKNADLQIIPKINFFQKLATPDFGASKRQLEIIGIDSMYSHGFYGEGMLIGILDNGFRNADKLSFFSSLFNQNRVLDTYDFVGNKKDVYDVGEHGMHCFSILAAFEDAKIVGSAIGASYALYHTEDDASESRLEEANWLIAAERADSVGVDIISSSLGYSEFDNSSQNYTYQDMNGQKTLVSRAAEFATQAGMLVVVAAGNEGSKPWKYIISPADADSIIAVGAVNSMTNYVSFSSIGPTADGRIKPDLMAMGSSTTIGLSNNIISNGNGTSYATPLVAGLAAGLWQAFPSLNNMQVRQYLLKSGNQYSTPDNKYGYGVPCFQVAYKLIKKELVVLNNEALNPLSIAYTYPNPADANEKIWIRISDNEMNTTYKLQLTDTNGIGIWEGTSTDKKLFLPPNFGNKSGVYYLRITSPKQSSTTKIIIP